MEHFFKNKSIVLFDGYCNLCDSSVQFVLNHEKNQELLFTSLQSELGKQLLNYFNLNNAESVILIENNKCYSQSSAALRITRYLKGAYPMLFLFIIVPPFIRNWVYNYNEKNRYKWYGKKDSCMIPNKELIKRFL